jgi:Family of unknown function (DUF5723)
MKLLPSLALLCFSIIVSNVNSQTEGSAFTLTGMGAATPFARDYQSLGINPGNLDITPEYDHYGTLGISEGAFSIYSELLTKPELRQNIFREDIKEFSQSQQRDLAIEFAKSNNAIDVDIMSLGFSMHTEKSGTFAFSTRDRVDFYSKLGSTVSELVWLGYNASYFDSLVVNIGNGQFDTIPNTTDIDPSKLDIVSGFTNLANAQSLSELLQGTKVGFSWFREFSLGYGKRILRTTDMEIHGGLGFKILVGQGMMEIEGAGGTAQAFSALSPLFNVDFDGAEEQNPSYLGKDAPPLQPVGFGFGVDLGATVIYKKNFILSAAVNDIGSIKWDGNLYKLKDIQLLDFENSGLESADIMEQVDQLNGSNGLLSWQGETSRVTKLPTTMRLGLGYDNVELFKVGIELVAPLSDDLTNMQSAAVAIGGEIRPLPWLHLQAGYTQGGNYGSKIPLGIYFTIGSGTYEFGIASRDALTFFRDNDPTISMAFGFLRFRF